MKGDTETRWVAYELDGGPIERDTHACSPIVLLIEAAFGPDLWRLRATLLDSREATAASMREWEDGCRAVGLKTPETPLVVDVCDRVAA
jgi:hypothetical protein